MSGLCKCGRPWSIFQEDRRRHEKIEAAYEAAADKRIDGRPAFTVRVALGGQGGEVALLQKVRFEWPPLGVYACFPVHDGGALVEAPVEISLELARELLEAFRGGAVRNQAVDQLAAAIGSKR